MIARRTMLGIATLPLLVSRVAAGTLSPTADWASGIVRAYDAQGHHRTGQLADLESAKWLAREASALGASVVVEEFSIDRVEPATCHLEVDGRRIPGVPMFDAAFTGSDGVTGRFGTEPGAEIGLATLGPLSIYGAAYEPYRRAPGSRALVTVTKGGKDGLALFNAERFLEPHGVPDLLVAAGTALPCRRLPRAGRRSASWPMCAGCPAPCATSSLPSRGGTARHALSW